MCRFCLDRSLPCLLLCCALLAPVSATAAPLPPREVALRPLDATIAALDVLLAQHWSTNELTPAERTDDHQFLRRVTLDLIGRIATPEELRDFTADRRVDKRLRMIDRLLQADECDAFWAELWTDELLPPSTDRRARRDFQKMLHRHTAQNGSYKELTERLLAATGKPTENPAVVFTLAHLGRELPKDRWVGEGRFEAIPLVEKVGRTFLAVDTHCIRCHDHAYDPELKQSHFWGLMGFVRQLDLVVEKPGDLLLRENPELHKDGFLLYERRNGIGARNTVQFLDGTRLKPDEQRPRRVVLADRVTNHANFSKAFVNRTWTHFFGRGLTEQPQLVEFNDSNPFVHPELIERLALDFAATGYEPKKLMRWICASDAYQQRDAGMLPPVASFHRAGWRPLTAEQRLNSMLLALKADATLTAQERSALRDGWRAALPLTPDNCEAHLVPADQPPSTALNLELLRFQLASPELAAALKHPHGTVAKALQAKRPDAILDQLFLAAYNRYPTAVETRQLLKQLTEPTLPQIPAAAWQDLFWTLLNTSEFLGNR